MKNRILLLLCCYILIASCEAEGDKVEEVDQYGIMKINNTSFNLNSGVINSYSTGYGVYKLELALTTADIAVVEDTSVLQDSIFRMVGFQIYSDNSSLETGDYIVQLNEYIPNTVHTSYYIDHYEIGGENEDGITIDSGVLTVTTSDSHYEIGFIGMDSLNNVLDVYYRGKLLSDYDLQ